MRLKTVPVIRAARPTVARAFVAHLIESDRKLKSLDDLESDALRELNRQLAKLSNEDLEHRFLEVLKGGAS